MAAATDNELKVSYAVNSISVFVLVALMAGHVTVNFQLAFGVFLAFQFWNSIWIRILLTSPNIYSVKVPTTMLTDWVQFSLPGLNADDKDKGVKIRKDRVVTSISELSGIRGTYMMLALRVMTAMINMLVLVAIQQQLHHRGTTLLSFHSGEDFAPLFMLILIAGFFLTGHFELNLMDGTHSTGHYLGVTLIFIGSLCVGFVLRWDVLSKSLIGLEYGLAVFWTWYTGVVEKKSPDISVVTRRSKICIGVELVMFIVTNVILVVTIYAGGKNEGNLWASPFL